MAGGLSLPLRLLSRIQQVFLLCRGLGAKKTIFLQCKERLQLGAGWIGDPDLQQHLPGLRMAKKARPALQASKEANERALVLSDFEGASRCKEVPALSLSLIFATARKHGATQPTVSRERGKHTWQPYLGGGPLLEGQGRLSQPAPRVW